MKSTEMRIYPINHRARALVLGVGLGAATAQAQVILEVGGAGTIGDTTLTTAKVPAAGVNWTAAGGEGIKYSSLTSPTFTVPATHVNGEMVTLKLTHRYNFEDAWDGGEIFVNVNGAGETYVDETA